jgi:plasmid stabilization system protein ParE
MSLRIQRSEWFVGDLEHYAAWYDRAAGWALAARYLQAVAVTLHKLSEMPTLGHPALFTSPELIGMRCVLVAKPFQKHLIFFRFDEATLSAERIIHSARDLARRLGEQPGS